MDLYSVRQHLMMVVVMFFTVTLQHASCSVSSHCTESHGALGQGFFIPKLDLLNDELQAVGAKIFDSVPSRSNCTVTSNVKRTQKDDTFYRNTESLYNSVSTNSKIGASLKGPYTLKTSLAAVTKGIVSDNSEVSGISLDLKTYSKAYSLKKDCINRQPLDKKLLDDFEGLEKEIKEPWWKNSWIKYKVFLEKHGSHVVKKVSTGSSIQQYVFAKSSKNFSQRDFTVKACLTLGGLTNVGKVGVSACSGITEEEANNASRTYMNKKLVIRGGTPETRAELSIERNKETITKFLQEGTSNPMPIAYQFVPIWNILKTRFIGTPSLAKVLNLEQFYKGYLHFGCPFNKTSNDKVLQKFVLSEDSDPEAPTYKCMLGPEGCHVPDDCHYKDAFWCACAGKSCIRYKDVKLNSGSTKKVAYAHTSKYPGWSGQGCELSGLKCNCTAPRSKWEESWSGDDDDGLRDVHYALAMKRDGVGALKDECDK